jgi:hypothetical protein
VIDGNGSEEFEKAPQLSTRGIKIQQYFLPTKNSVQTPEVRWIYRFRDVVLDCTTNALFGYSSDDLGKAVNSQTLCNFSRCSRSRSTQAPNFCQPLPRSKEHVCSPTCRSSPPAPASQILCPVITQCNYPIAPAVSFPGPVCGTTNLFPETGT